MMDVQCTKKPDFPAASLSPCADSTTTSRSGTASPTPSALPPLVLVHGWMDVAASWQFMVDAFSDAFAAGRTIIAPDWRGFGQTGLTPAGYRADSYWFADYLADLDFVLDHYAPGQAVDLVGHSMGGNVAMLYGGVRPARIRRLVNLEGFGLPGSRPSQAPGRLAQWMDGLKSLEQGEMALKSYDDQAGVARRLMKTNPRLTPDKAHWLAGHWARPDAAGQWQILGNPAHKIPSAQLYRVDEVQEIHQRISAPVLAVEASERLVGPVVERQILAGRIPRAPQAGARCAGRRHPGRRPHAAP